MPAVTAALSCIRGRSVREGPHFSPPDSRFLVVRSSRSNLVFVCRQPPHLRIQGPTHRPHPTRRTREPDAADPSKRTSPAEAASPTGWDARNGNPSASAWHLPCVTNTRIVKKRRPVPPASGLRKGLQTGSRAAPAIGRGATPHLVRPASPPAQGGSDLNRCQTSPRTRRPLRNKTSSPLFKGGLGG